jgi:predicted transcriptional regulator
MTKIPKPEGRAALLKRLREEHAETVALTQARLKENNQVRKAIIQSIREESKTVPAIAAEVGMPTTQVLWHLTAYKKYDIVVEDGMDGDYVRYKKVEEAA